MYIYNSFIFPSDDCRYTKEKRFYFVKQLTQELVLLKYGNCLYKVAAIKNFLHPIFSEVLLP